MRLIELAVLVVLVLVNLAGLTRAFQCLIGRAAIARGASWLVVALVLFGLEHTHGFGSLTWAMPLTTAAAVAVLWRVRRAPDGGEFLRSELVFLACFAYGFAWRFAFPSLYPTSEHITDLFFISNYIDGDTLPPLDRWHPPHRFDYYYAFQHYAAALLGRLFGLDGGTTYQIAFALLTGATIALGWEIVHTRVHGRTARALLMAAFVCGGTGFSPLVHLVVHGPALTDAGAVLQDANARVIASQRFIGGYDANIDTALGEALFPRVRPDSVPHGFEPRELPLESFGYQLYIGDYHPPVGSYFLLALAIATMFAIEAGTLGLSGPLLLGLTLPAVLIVNTWVFPLHGLLLAGWWLYRRACGRGDELVPMIAGALVGFMLAWPFLAPFASHALDTPLRPVALLDHTPATRFIGLHWPLILLVLIAYTQPTARRLSLALGITFALALVLTEWIYVDDPTEGRYERTNSTMKWWGWVWTGGLLALGSIGAGSAARWARWSTMVICALLSVYWYDLARYYVVAGKDDAGWMSGHHWYTSDRNHAALIDYLRNAPPGIVLENLYDNAYTNSTMHALFSDKPSLLGWPSHLVAWHGDSPEVWHSAEAVKGFFAGTMQDSLAWLRANHVRYVVWSAADNGRTPGAFAAIDGRIAPGYVWREFYTAGDYRVGVWERR